MKLSPQIEQESFDHIISGDSKYSISEALNLLSVNIPIQILKSQESELKKLKKKMDRSYVGS